MPEVQRSASAVVPCGTAVKDDLSKRTNSLSARSPKISPDPPCLHAPAFASDTVLLGRGCGLIGATIRAGRWFGRIEVGANSSQTVRERPCALRVQGNRCSLDDGATSSATANGSRRYRQGGCKAALRMFAPTRPHLHLLPHRMHGATRIVHTPCLPQPRPSITYQRYICPLGSHGSNHSGNQLEMRLSEIKKGTSLRQAINPSEVQILVERYPLTSRIMHWSVAILVLATWLLGILIQFAKQEVSSGFYLMHESIGFLLLWLMLLRIGNKLIAKAPHQKGDVTTKLAASVVHGLLYLFLVVMPVSGFLATNAHGFPLVWFGIVPIWSPLAGAPEIADALSTVHVFSAWALLTLFVLHFGAVLLHHVIKRDTTLYRIL
jgi:cytochrome b561